MTDYNIIPEDIVADFIRVHLTDPRARAEATDTDSFVATAGQTDFTLTPDSGSVSCVTAVTVNSVAKTKWKDYFWDYQNQKVIFFTGLTLSDDVDITFKYGTSNWVYSDKPDDKLKATNFPRIAIFHVSGSGNRLGRYNAPVESSIIFQIDIWTKDGYIATIGSNKYSNEFLGRYLGLQITKAFEENESDLFPALYNYIPSSTPRDAPFSQEYQAYHTMLEINLKGLNVGRVST